jgi:hypothetical protein
MYLVLPSAYGEKGDLLGVDLAIDDDPGPPTQLRAGRQVDDHWLPVGPQVLHNHRPSLQERKGQLR